VRAVLVESMGPKHLAWAGPGYHYMLMGVATESRALAELAADGKHLTFDLYLPGSGSNLPAERIVVTRMRHRLHVERQTPSASASASIDCGLDGLADLLASIMTGARR
jgi:hypothetical protein